jgi:hypothetical protein
MSVRRFPILLLFVAVLTMFSTCGQTAAPGYTGQATTAPEKKLKDAGITPIALGEKDKWPGHFYWVYLAMRVGGQDAFTKAYTRQGSFADPAYVEAGQHLNELVDLQPFQTGFLGAGYPDHQAVMANGQAGMELMGHWAPGAELLPAGRTADHLRPDGRRRERLVSPRTSRPALRANFVMLRTGVKMGQNGARTRWHHGNLVIVAGEFAHRVERIEQHDRHEFDFVAHVAPQ